MILQVILIVQWSDKRTNESILEELSATKELLAEINKRKLKYIGHANRNTKTQLMKTVLQGKLESKRKRGKPPTSYASNIKKISGLKVNEVAQKCLDRKEWRRIVEASTAAANIDPDDADR